MDVTAATCHVVTPFRPLDRRLALGAFLDVQFLHEFLVRLGMARRMISVLATCHPSVRAVAACADDHLAFGTGVCPSGAHSVDVLTVRGRTVAEALRVLGDVGFERRLEKFFQGIGGQIVLQLREGEDSLAFVPVSFAADTELGRVDRRVRLAEVVEAFAAVYMTTVGMDWLLCGRPANAAVGFCSLSGGASRVLGFNEFHCSAVIIFRSHDEDALRVEDVVKCHDVAAQAG